MLIYKIHPQWCSRNSGCCEFSQLKFETLQLIVLNKIAALFSNWALALLAKPNIRPFLGFEFSIFPR